MTARFEIPLDHRTYCLTHFLPEDQASNIGLICPRCRQRLYTQPPSGTCRSFWESQPAAYSLHQQPCFVYTLQWDDFCIRSLHPPGDVLDSRSQIRTLPSSSYMEGDDTIWKRRQSRFGDE
ncbi:MAG: hypothetical protein O2955_05180 [Planctomycetota bacterium]|nr:hypothetical protein [Planctomycetota bacterium]MDA1211886.1 hypothetical protein [Planctomycetota bacterium]